MGAQAGGVRSGPPVRVVLAALVLVALAVAGRAASARTVMVVGDSLSAAYGIALEDGWTHLLGERLAERSRPWQVVNASISGETTRGALVRLPADLAAHAPGIVIVELGGNDGLRGLPLEETRRNLEGIVETARAAGAQVLLLGMRIPPNLGPRYAEAFHAIYGELAEAHGLALVPFFLEGVGGVDGMMQEDGIHPRAEAQPVLLDNVWPHLEPLL